ncbi:hypothetical protein DFR58_101126 [Anaerobacterium chartisolvens]|uniref:Uncharacterized protein n=1 Tax=Anaerobacterium chartisolvens TaxID=1297424 RepID=A0A369BML3_9FIRM|nr:hypothetical protein [Anaerobacterium chartisolvens]RCX20924.1 hypothetical protein DFR58_101126 [Anaerobacterium chartisolvens]
MNVIDYILRISIISVPEQIFLVLMFVRFLKAYNLFNNKGGLFLWAILVPSLISNTLRLFPSMDSSIIIILGVIINTVIISLMAKVSWKNGVMSVLFGTVLFASSELLCVNIIIYSSRLTLASINSNILMAALATIPERIVQYFFAYMAYVKWRGHEIKTTQGVITVDVFDVIWSCTKNKVLTVSILSFNTIFVIIAGKFIMFDKILAGTPPVYALLVCIALFTIPFLTALLLYEISRRIYCNNIIYLSHFSDDIKNHAESLLSKAIAEGASDGLVDDIKKIIQKADFT